MPNIILSSDVNRLLTCQDYDNNILATLDRSNHTGTQMASTISDFCNAVSNCPIITDHTNRITLLEGRVEGIWNDFYNPGGYLDNLINDITNNYTGVDEAYVIASHVRVDIPKDAPISDLSLDQVQSSDTTIATLGWVKREWSEQLPEGVAWLDPSSKGFERNSFSGVHDFIGSDTVVMGNTTNIATPGWELVNGMHVNQALAALNNLPIVSIGEPGVTNQWNRITWTPGEITINGVVHTVSSGNRLLDTTSSTHYVYYDNGVVVASTPPDSQRLIATVYLTPSSSIGTVTQPTLDLSLLAKLAGANIFTGSNIFNSPVTLNNLNGTKANYTIPLASNNKTVANTEWVNDRIDHIVSQSGYWIDTAGVEGNLRISPILAEDGETFVDLRGFQSLSTTPISTDPGQTIATKEYVDDLFESSLGIPIVTLVGLNPPVVNWTEGVVNIPPHCIDSMGYDHDVCNVAGSTQDVTLSESIRYVYVDYATCSISFSCDPVDQCVGLVVAVLNCTNGVCSVSVVDGECCENFTGTPTSTTPDLDDCSDRIPTTDWVCQKLYNLIHGQCGGDFPRVYQITRDGQKILSVGVTSGSVYSERYGGQLTIHETVDPIGVTAVGTEYLWIRFIDQEPFYTIVVSASQPTATEGLLIATITKTSGNNLNIQHTETIAVETYISANYRAAWGGKLVYVGPVEC